MCLSGHLSCILARQWRHQGLRWAGSAPLHSRSLLKLPCGVQPLSPVVPIKLRRLPSCSAKQFSIDPWTPPSGHSSVAGAGPHGNTIPSIHFILVRSIPCPMPILM